MVSEFRQEFVLRCATIHQGRGRFGQQHGTNSVVDCAWSPKSLGECLDAPAVNGDERGLDACRINTRETVRPSQ